MPVNPEVGKKVIVPFPLSVKLPPATVRGDKLVKEAVLISLSKSVSFAKGVNDIELVLYVA